MNDFTEKQRKRTEKLKKELNCSLKETSPVCEVRRRTQPREILEDNEVSLVVWVIMVYCVVELDLSLDNYTESVKKIVGEERISNDSVETRKYWKKDYEHECGVPNGEHRLELTVTDKAIDESGEITESLSRDEKDILVNEKKILQVCANKTKNALSGQISQFFIHARMNIKMFYEKYNHILNALYRAEAYTLERVVLIFEQVNLGESVMKSMIYCAKMSILMIMENILPGKIFVEHIKGETLEDSTVDVCESGGEDDEEESSDDDDLPLDKILLKINQK